MMKQFFLREQRNFDCTLAFITANWKAMSNSGSPMSIQITDDKAKRSTIANRYYLAVLGQIAEDAWIEGRQFNSDLWHEYFKRKFIGSIDLPGCGTMAESTAKLNVSEFAQYVQKIEVFAATELGVTFMDSSEQIGRNAA